MTQSRIAPVLTGIRMDRTSVPVPPVTARARLVARLFAGRYDRRIEAGVGATYPGALAAHCVRLTSADERVRLAGVLQRLVRTADTGQTGASARVPLQRGAIRASAGLIDEIALRLRAPEPVRARGMARLRLALTDGTGPLYRAGRGSLAAQLRGVLAAL
jgi:hypothetical protein